MSRRRQRQERKIIEGCAIDKLCNDPCKSQHKRNFNTRTKETIQCPAYYKFFIENRKVEIGRGWNRRKVDKLIKVELR